MAEQATTDRLEQYNASLLIKRVEAKLREGKKPLTKQEQAIIAKAELSQQRAAALPYLERMPKGEFIEQYGGDYKVFINWSKRWGFPWPENSDHVNVNEVLRWFREHTAGRSKPVGLDPDDHAKRLKKAQADREELKLAQLRGELLMAADVERDFLTYGRIIREAIEMIETVSGEAHRIMVEALDKLEAQFELEDDDSETDS